MFTKTQDKLPAFFMVLIILALSWTFLSMGSLGIVYAAEAKPHVFKLENNKSTAFLKVGEKMHIVLEARPSTGYSWQIIRGNRATLKPGKVQFRQKTDLVGGPEEQIIMFNALRRGKTTIELRYMKPWEKYAPTHGPPNFLMNIEVTE
jgi:predicted secreted protein